MNDIITVCGIVATEPRHLVTETGIAITSLRLASPSRRWDRASSTWVNGATNWYTVTAFRSLASNVFKSLKKGDRIVVAGRVRIRTWERDGRSGTSVEIDADGIGHDLAWGISNWVRVPRQVGDTAAGHGGVRSVDLETGEVREPAPDAGGEHAAGQGRAPEDDGALTGDPSAADPLLDHAAIAGASDGGTALAGTVLGGLTGGGSQRASGSAAPDGDATASFDDQDRDDRHVPEAA
ncbi:single-stranded DNA-binding protein [Curtobacterium oceanosedimentum]|uniref:single-stranded DNA-binding protein n=1 Tax=Curtobacterium oceanosedimentum TaxID=465820 RepID=UPI001CE1E02F|nr:single-stranded DNA-binding protein [Curtobacterium oceanosedimentum]MCA5923608.1 single-stranded DNA-binding protein [Curtobacterium oceanosedimentum]